MHADCINYDICIDAFMPYFSAEKKDFFCLFFPVSVEKSANNHKIIISFLH